MTAHLRAYLSVRLAGLTMAVMSTIVVPPLRRSSPVSRLAHNLLRVWLVFEVASAKRWVRNAISGLKAVTPAHFVCLQPTVVKSIVT